MRPLLLLLLSAALACGEPFLRENDIVSFIGGEDAAVAAELGEIELALTVGNPTLYLHFRSLAHEGDTVFEQHRDLNYPPLEEQLATTGTTVLLADFGPMEKLSGHSPAEFIQAYEQLLDRCLAGSPRRVVLLASAYLQEVRTLGERRGWPVVACPSGPGLTRDAIHLNEAGHAALAQTVAAALEARAVAPAHVKVETVRALIRAKNRLWFHYYRPQNWAFLAGDRVNQPSSRDHLDPTKRWFPAEMQQFLPLISAKESEIYTSVADLP